MSDEQKAVGKRVSIWVVVIGLLSQLISFWPAIKEAAVGVAPVEWQPAVGALMDLLLAILLIFIGPRTQVSIGAPKVGGHDQDYS